MNIEHITILRSESGCDVVILYTDLPSGVFPFTGNAEVKMNLANGTGEEYIKQHFTDISYTMKDI